MTTLTINLPDDQARKLHDLAKKTGASPEELVRTSIEEWLARPELTFADAADYVLEKNRELYRRLA